jgi:hypothetical protein
VLQVLQERRGLLFGKGCARYLSAVSGGSYTAAAAAINSRHLREVGDDGSLGGVPPLAKGSPEEDHILSHADYLKPGLRIAFRFLLLVSLNFAALLVLFAWTGFMLGDAAFIAEHVHRTSGFTNFMERLPVGVSVVALIGSVFILVGGLYSGSLFRRYAQTLLGLLGIGLFADPTFLGLEIRSWFTSTTHWLVVLLVAMAVLFATAAGGFLLQRAHSIGLLSAVANWSQVVTVRVSGGVLMLWSGLIWYRIDRAGTGQSASTSKTLATFVGLFATLLLGYAFSFVPDRASLHREYRERIQSCFGVVRTQAGGVVELGRDFLISQLADGGPVSPQLLICATANVHNRDAANKTRAYAPFVMTHDRCGVPGTGASFPTTKLELLRVPRGFWRAREPIMSLFTAVATTGAAISPSMGRKTLPSARPLLAAANVRLGRWLPNPYSRRMTSRLALRTTPWTLRGLRKRDERMGPGYDELIPEMLGISGLSVYVSDGGHFDNLGLSALLRARCTEVWCVDSSPDRRGAAQELRRVLDAAAEELNIRWTINLDSFAVNGGFYGTTYAHGHVDYGPGQVTQLHVVKLGLAQTSPDILKQYRDVDRGFPHHSTFKQWYTRARFVAYRDLGRASTEAAISAISNE